MSEFLSLEDLTLAYGGSVAVDRLNLAIRQGELIALLGPSGCGKTTTMRAIAGLLAPRSGTIRLDGKDITRVAPSRREVGLVFQSYALFPHLSVFENVAFGLRLRKEPDLAARVAEGLATVGLSDFADRAPAALSGGQQQRVALARSLVMNPKVLLLDEPLSNLDARLRLEMRMELQRVQRETGVTMVFVTHDQAEALALADRIVVMRGGAIEQVGTPEQIWTEPASGFVADFVGFETILPDPETGGALAWRPAAVTLGSGPHSGVIRGASFAGAHREYVLDTPLGVVKAETPASAPPLAPGAEVAFDLPRERAVRLASA
ncbi:putative spermidine/putrescine transport system ATP-binding protein [Albimonas donghaensis]|uniref:Putative spermidine/putrescine transport system ATP-binding protein n=1 Tax=Albimonas donghaensis TaxID=356660 RepID=A0A1H3C1G9_9RHOB|nr:ABC transporter ATP-binding protein [Albimonas donghaensis]SDX47901.1 putative spermidine/putrescine transport system ATP-binding protein [Albimonas donghaensis]